MTTHAAVVVGAGFSGLAAGVYLKRAGITDFVILEMLLHKGPQKVSDIGRRVGLPDRGRARHREARGHFQHAARVSKDGRFRRRARDRGRGENDEKQRHRP